MALLTFEVRQSRRDGSLLVKFDDDLGLAPGAYGRLFRAQRPGGSAIDPFAGNHPIITSLLSIDGVTSATPEPTYVRFDLERGLAPEVVSTVTSKICGLLQDYLGWPNYIIT